MIYKNNIIPAYQIRTGPKEDLDLPSICVFMALGYFLGDKTFYKGHRQHLPASITETDDEGRVLSVSSHFTWHYSPRDISFNQALDEFSHLFENIVNEQGASGYTIPISGGLDSRTLVAACASLNKKYRGYSYAFEGGHDETIYGRMMSEFLGFPYDAFRVQRHTLWSYVDQLAQQTECYAEFTHARQYAFHKELSGIGGTFLLGHGGDLYFDDMGVPSDLKGDELFRILWNRIVKKSSFELAEAMWIHWGLNGSFRDYLEQELRNCLDGISIDDGNAKLRAYKSMFYVPRWTCVNLQVFRDFSPVVMPYFDDRICAFICTIPEHLLKGRKIQIEYLKMKDPRLAKIPWQSHYPFNVNNYQYDKFPYNIPIRIKGKIKRLLTGKEPIRRNWELQFQGSDNEREMERCLFDDPNIHTFIPKNIIEKHWKNFRDIDPLGYYPSMTMLLTLSKFISLHHSGLSISSRTLIDTSAGKKSNAKIVTNCSHS